MEFKATAGSLTDIAADAVVVNLFQGVTKPGGATGAVDKALGGLISQLIASGEIKGKLNEAAVLHTQGRLPSPRVVVAGLGKREDFNLSKLQQVMGTVCRTLRGRGCKRVATIVHGAGVGRLEVGLAVRAAVEGALIGLFTADAYKTENRTEAQIEELIFVEQDRAKLPAIRKGIELGRITGESTNLARSLVNEPSNQMTPTIFAQRAAEVAKAHGLKMEALELRDIQKLGMNAFYGVAKGSDEPAKLVILRYLKAKSKQAPTIGLVGKGITFDSGGISIKPDTGMETMKGDMAGAAAALAAIKGIAESKAAANVMAVMPLTENMPSGHAQKPGDIVRALSGKTIEIISTDAEGRLILADAVAYARQLGCTHLVDIATLTGAVVVALGNVAAGLFSNSQDLANRILRAAEKAGEKFWQLPLFPEYREQIKSVMADIKNTGGRPGGPSTAAIFIQESVGDTPWAHLDIAGTSWTDKETSWRSKEGTGMAVRTLINLVWDWAR